MIFFYNLDDCNSKVIGIDPETKIQDLVHFLVSKCDQPFSVSEVRTAHAQERREEQKLWHRKHYLLLSFITILYTWCTYINNTLNSQSFIRDGKAFLIIDSRQEAMAVLKLSGIRYHTLKVSKK